MLTHRTPSYLVEWTQQMAMWRYKHFRGEKEYPVRGGHALCDMCVGELLFTGQLRWHNQIHDDRHSFHRGFCEGCQRGAHDIHMIVIKKTDNGWRFGIDYFLDTQQRECMAFFRYECKNNLYIRTIYLPKCPGDIPTKYSEHGALICDECFKDIEESLVVISYQSEEII